MMSEGFIREETNRITVPVLMAMGARDVNQHPELDPGAFAQARDVSVFAVPSMAHMYNFASTRLTLWSKIDCWAIWSPLTCEPTVFRIDRQPERSSVC